MGGRIEVTLRAWSANMLATKIAGLILGVELVDAPVALTDRLGQIGAALVAQFPDTSVPSPPLRFNQ